MKSNIGEGERGRPAQFADSGYKSVPPAGAPPPEFLLTTRGNALLNALPNEPINQARADAIRWILSNPIYDKGA